MKRHETLDLTGRPLSYPAAVLAALLMAGFSATPPATAAPAAAAIAAEAPAVGTAIATEAPAVATATAPAAPAAAAEPAPQATIEGTWTTRAREDDDGDRFVEVSMELDTDRGNWGWWVDPEELQGLSYPQFRGDVADARFELVRGAGTTLFVGVIRDGRGTGTFAFTPSATWRREMEQLGYDDLSTRQAFQAAIHDIDVAYVRVLQTLGYMDLAERDLFSFAIHRVSVDFIREMNGLGYAEIPARQLITMRIHGVTGEWVRQVRAAMGR